MRPASTKSARRGSFAAALVACPVLVASCRSVGGEAGMDGAVSADAARPSDARAEVADAPVPRGLDAAAALATDGLDGGADLQEMPVPGYLAAFLSVPNGSTGARPVVVALHGVGDRPDWQCLEWRKLVGPIAWVVCPRGIVSERWSTPGDTRWTWHGPPFMKKELDAAVAALAARFGARVDPERMVYGGFSYGAANGPAIVAKDAARFPYVVLTEGGGDRWTLDFAKDFVKNGGERVLFVCGQAPCVPGAERTGAMIARAGVKVRIEHGEGEGHAYGGAVAARIRDAWPWVTAGDPRWALPSTVAPSASGDGGGD